uniref:Uncharacterized protein n=1 Tax=Leersia perrieri TaxID=77586 RepID=A0A0D9WDD1_9ORYZ
MGWHHEILTAPLGYKDNPYNPQTEEELARLTFDLELAHREARLQRAARDGAPMASRRGGVASSAWGCSLLPELELMQSAGRWKIQIGRGRTSGARSRVYLALGNGTEASSGEAVSGKLQKYR